MANVAARAELVLASYAKCSRTLERGEVKRVMQRGPLIGYFLCCPSCGFAASYLDEDSGSIKGCDFIELPPKTEPLLDLKKSRELIFITHLPICFRCHRILRVLNGFLESLDP